MLDFRIDTFLAVCRSMNFTRAAEELHITQPAVSQHIRYLEKSYGVKLFDYQGKRLSLTTAGEALFSAAVTMKHDDLFLKKQLPMPALVSKNHGLWTLGSFYLSLNLLLLICRIYAGGNWLAVTFCAITLGFAVIFLPQVLRQVPLPQTLSSHKTLLCFLVDTLLIFALVTVSELMMGSPARLLPVDYPVVLYGITLPWLCMVVIRYLRVNPFFKASICAAGTGVYFFFTNSILHTLIDARRLLFRPSI